MENSDNYIMQRSKTLQDNDYAIYKEIKVRTKLQEDGYLRVSRRAGNKHVLKEIISGLLSG
jgi:hypothetical protein